MEARGRSPADWLTRIRTRQLVLPRFQRFEAWSYSQKTALLNTILQELPAGALLVLEIGEKEPFHSRPVDTAPSEGEKINEHLLDGQQRVTTLWKSMNDKYDDRTFFIKIERDEELDLPYFATSEGRYYRYNKKYPLWCEDPQELWQRQLIPVRYLRPDAHSENEFNEWSKAAASDNIDEFIKLKDLGNELRNKFSKFNMPFLSLPVTTKPEIALNVFIQMNTSSSPLSAFDIVVAQIEASSGKSLHYYLEELRQEVPNVSRFADIEGTVLAVAALLFDKAPSKGTYLDRTFAESLESNWNKIKKGIKKAISFLNEEKVLSSKILASNVVLYVISALWSEFEEGLDKEGEVRVVVRKYLWRAFFTERYDRLTNTRAYQDYNEIKSYINSELNLPTIFNETLYPISDSSHFRTANWPTKRDRLARALLNVTLKAGGYDFADGAPISYQNLLNREYHHVFPKAWLLEKGFKEYEVDIALNCALISWKTNRNISAKKPSIYIEERMNSEKVNEDEITRRLSSHLIPINELNSNDYSEFIQSRAELIEKQVKKLCNGQTIESYL